MQHRLTNYKHTIVASYFGYITQAVINNFAPLLFVTFYSSYGISLGKIGLLVSVNFGTQLLVDLLAAKFVDKIGYRPSIIAAHIFCALGLVALGTLPDVLPSAYAGIVIAVVIYAIGGGLTEVLISPIVEACPTDKKSASMSLLHSFYCWGSVFVVLLSTLLFRVCGIDAWRYIAMGWAVIPILNAVYFAFVPMAQLNAEGDGMKLRELFGTGIFWVFILLMLCAGASELAIAQWVSAFAESGLGVSKTVGDILGPCLFAVCMGTARVLHAKIGHKISLQTYLLFCALGCVAGYLLASLVPNAAIALVGCGVCGFSVGAMWPCVFSLSSHKCPKGGTALFALLALAGDCGCALGPSLVGFVSGQFGDAIHIGLLFAAVFPVLLAVGLLLLRIVSRGDDSPQM